MQKRPDKKTDKITIRVPSAFKTAFVQHCQELDRSESWVGMKYIQAGMEADRPPKKQPRK